MLLSLFLFFFLSFSVILHLSLINGKLKKEYPFVVHSSDLHLQNLVWAETFGFIGLPQSNIPLLPVLF